MSKIELTRHKREILISFLRAGRIDLNDIQTLLDDEDKMTDLDRSIANEVTRWCDEQKRLGSCGRSE